MLTRGRERRHHLFQAFLQDRIFVPLNMVDTSFAVPDTKRARFADQYMRKGQMPGMLSLGANAGNEDSGLLNITNFPFEEYHYHKDLDDPSFVFNGGGGLAGTVDDYSQFAVCMLNGGEKDGRRILSRKTVEVSA